MINDYTNIFFQVFQCYQIFIKIELRVQSCISPFMRIYPLTRQKKKQGLPLNNLILNYQIILAKLLIPLSVSFWHAIYLSHFRTSRFIIAPNIINLVSIYKINIHYCNFRLLATKLLCYKVLTKLLLHFAFNTNYGITKIRNTNTISNRFLSTFFLFFYLNLFKYVLHLCLHDKLTIKVFKKSMNI